MSLCVSQFAASFVVVGPKTSIAERIKVEFSIGLLDRKDNRKSSELVLYCYVNDPSAGSPTETLLRLLLPLGDKVHKTFHCRSVTTFATVRIIHRNTQSVGATGGVYKGQGRNQHKLMTCAY